MPTSNLRRVVIGDLRGGRNGADPPDSLPDNQAVEMLNVDNYTGLLGNKRNGASAVTESGGTAFSSGIQSLFRFVPGADETLAELWAIDGAATPIVKRMASGSTFADVTLTHAIQTSPHRVHAVTFNGKLYLAYDSSVDRLHVYDPSLSSPRVRVVGFTTPNPPTVANNATGGTYAATLRYYRVRMLEVASSVVIRMSEPSTSVSFTPDGSHTAAVVTQPVSLPGEQETHWRVEVSLDNVNFFKLSDVAIATTTYSDSAATSTYSSNSVSAATGEYTNWTSVRYLLTDGNRLLGAGAWETPGKNSRVWFSPVLGTTDEGDDERVPNTTTHQNWVDLNENDGGFITGLGGPVYGVPFAFKYRQIWKLNPTGDDTVPYIPRKISDVYGSINHEAIVHGRDHMGNPALYFLSPDGPCRIVIYQGAATVQYLGRDVEDIWATVNLAATTVVSHGVYHASRKQVWFWVATGSSNDPDTKLCFDVALGMFVEGDRVRGGWYKHTGNSAAARCSVMMSNTLGATMSRDLKPYIGRASGTAIWKLDDASALDDAGTSFQAYIKTKPLRLAQLGQNVGIGQSVMVAKTGDGITITQTLDRDYGLETRTSTALLTPEASETRVIRKFQASELAQAGAVQVQLGDGAAQTGAWSIDLLEIPIIDQEWR